jgi:hypothetical protein
VFDGWMMFQQLKESTLFFDEETALPENVEMDSCRFNLFMIFGLVDFT